MRQALSLGLLAALLSGCELLNGEFHLMGRVDLAAQLSGRATKPGEMLFVVAQNEGGVPVAMRRIVNPEFPVEFTLGPDDLLVPAVRGREPLQVHAELNSHGEVGYSQETDLYGTAPDTVAPGAHNVAIILDHAPRPSGLRRATIPVHKSRTRRTGSASSN
jgi:hypothetical protein